MSFSFISLCKLVYINGNTPSQVFAYKKKEYKRILLIAKEYFRSDNYIEFSSFLTEPQYNISLWAAHMLLEYGHPPVDIYNVALDVIETYSQNSFDEKIAIEEHEWLLNWKKQHKE